MHSTGRNFALGFDLRHDFKSLAILPLLILCSSLWLTACAAGTRSRTAEALDIHGEGVALSYSPLASNSGSATNPAEQPRIRWRRSSTITPPPTVGQRIGGIVGWFGGLGIITLCLALVLAPGAVAAFALRTASKFRAAFVQTARALHDADTVSRDGATHDALSARQDDQTKTLVAKVKNGTI